MQTKETTLAQGSPINDVGNWEGEGSKIGQNCQQIVLKILQPGHGGGGGCKKLPTSFMDGPLACRPSVLLWHASRSDRSISE